MKTQETQWATDELRRFKSQATPGPWQAVTADDDEPGLFSIWPDVEPDKDRKLIATVYDSNGPLAVDTANARLIAGAPSLYAALRDMLATFEQDGWTAPRYMQAQRGEAIKFARSALAKATGQA